MFHASWVNQTQKIREENGSLRVIVTTSRQAQIMQQNTYSIFKVLVHEHFLLPSK